MKKWMNSGRRGGGIVSEFNVPDDEVQALVDEITALEAENAELRESQETLETYIESAIAQYRRGAETPAAIFDQLEKRLLGAALKEVGE